MATHNYGSNDDTSPIISASQQEQGIEQISSEPAVHTEDSEKGLVQIHNTSEELKEFREKVLKQYNWFLKLVSWKKIWDEVKFDFGWAVIISLALLCTIILQNVTCFDRVKPANYKVRNQSLQSHLLISCTHHRTTDKVIPHLLIIIAFPYGFYFFRYGEPEALVCLMETTFRSYTDEMRRNKKKIIYVLRSYLWLGYFWIGLDICLNGLRVYSLQLLHPHSFNPIFCVPVGREYNSSTFHNTEENILRYILVPLSIVGLVFFDLLYFAVVVAYGSYCQLIKYYVTRIMEKVKEGYNLNTAIKEIEGAQKFLEILNKKLSLLTSLMLFLFLGSLLSSIYNLNVFPEKDAHEDYRIFYAGVVVGAGNILQWSLLAAAPFIQAARLTSCCKQLMTVGLHIGSRPYAYTKTPDLDLGNFVQYTNVTSCKYTAKLAGLPVYPSYLIGFIFFGGVVCCFFISYLYDYHFKFADWF